NKDEQLANLEKPPNHHKFNTLPGRQYGSKISLLLQRRLTERNQQAASNSGSVINFNIPPKLLTMFQPANVVQPVEQQPFQTPQTDSSQSLLPSTTGAGPDLSLDEFCILYSLSDDIRAKLRENGYTSTETLTFILVPELHKMDFKFGEIAAMKAAMRCWAK
ncbi:hypothetical protein BDN67DRAFT_985941, partial [Paxillus ammoniavirescens]